MLKLSILITERIGTSVLTKETLPISKHPVKLLSGSVLRTARNKTLFLSARNGARDSSQPTAPTNSHLEAMVSLFMTLTLHK